MSLGFPGVKVKRKLFKWSKKHMQKPRGRVIYKQESMLNVIYQKLSLWKSLGIRLER